MADNDQNEQNDQKIEAASNLKELQQESKVLNSWVKSSKDLIDKYKNKFDAFKAMANQTDHIDESAFSIGGEQNKELFKKIDANGDGKITQDEWNLGWNNLESEAQETQHKIQIAQQKVEILDVLDSKIAPGKKLAEPIVSTQYNNLLDQFKSASTLEDLSDLFNKKSPFRENHIEEPLTSSNNVFDLDQKRASARTIDTLLQQFKTPNREEILIDTGSNKNVNSYIKNTNPVPQVNLKLSKSPVSKFGFLGLSPAPQYNNSSAKKQENLQINSKVQQTMNFNLEVKDSLKPQKRKDDLNNFMSKLGLGKYEAPKVTINLDYQNQNVYERLKYQVNNLGGSSSKRTPSQGLDELVNDKSFTSSTFKQQLKAYKRERGDSQHKNPMGQSYENPLLQDQSLKSFHLKLMHQQRSGSAYRFARS